MFTITTNPTFYLFLIASIYLCVSSEVENGGSEAEGGTGGTKDVTKCSDISGCKSCLANVLCKYLTCGEDEINPKCVNSSESATACGDKTAMITEKCGNGTQEDTKKNDSPSLPSENGDETPEEEGKEDEKSSANDNPVDELVDEVKPIDKKQEPKYHATQHFDLASFTGGIALSLCIFGLVFIIFKFYSSRQQNIAYSSVDGKNQY